MVDIMHDNNFGGFTNLRLLGRDPEKYRGVWLYASYWGFPFI